MKPQNKTAAIIGVGQIGGSLGLALKKSDFFEKIYGYDKNTQQLKLAETFLDKCFDDIEETVKNSDIIILASPINSILETLRFGFENFPQKLYTDVGSTKFPMLKLSSKMIIPRLLINILSILLIDIARGWFLIFSLINQDSRI